MQLAIADPPYLGRGRRWYGTGRGHQRSAPAAADSHPDAHTWDSPDTHAALVAQLEADYDGWAVAAAPDSLHVYLATAPTARVMVWHRANAVPSGARVGSNWEAVIIRIPPSRRGHGTGLATADVLTAPAERRGFVGAKPEAWTRWVLATLGYDPESDTVHDMFPGSGAVSRAANGILI